MRLRARGGLVPALFSLGQCVATPKALDLLEEASVAPAELLARPQGGDWGEVPPEDARENDLSVREGFRILSSYPVGTTGGRVWLLTEADRSSTCILLPSEY